MKNKITLPVFLFVSATFLLWRCGNYSNSTITRQNFATQYNSDEKILRPKYVLQNITDSLTRLYFSVNSADLLYASNYHDNGYSAHILLFYVIHPVDYPKIVTDSGHV
ncbi:MAG TPA: hypothetical protein VFJ43_12345, partial [Bacteroidia bacterium]|nr:hypothetical protein [Bacteroidia bacterium]